MNIKLDNATYKELLTEIRKQSEFTFVYNVDDLETLKRVDCDFEASTVQKILDHCFEQTNMTYEVRDKVIIIIPKKSTEGRPIKLPQSSKKLFIQQNGEIQGSIYDKAGEPVAYANVQLMGTSMGTISNDKGFYSIKKVPPGSYELRVTFVGYSDSQTTVQVTAGEVITHDFQLTITSILGEEVVVTAMARGQAKAINTQIAARNIKNVVSEQKIRELPDANAAEALARLPGVSVIRSGGEAVAVNIRGVSSNTMFVNGMRLDGGLGSISASMIGGIELNKAFMADQDADVLGGNVEFRMREAQPGFKKEIWVRSGYNGFTRSMKMQDVSALVSNRFFNNRMGVMVGLNYDRKDRGRDVLSAGYETREASETGSEDILNVYLSSVNLSHNENLKNRYGATVYTDFRLKGGKLYYQAFLSHLNSESYTLSNGFSTTANVDYRSVYNHSYDRSFLQGLGGEHTLLGAKVEWGVSMSKRRNETPEYLSYQARNPSGFQGGKAEVDTSTTINEFLDFATHDLDVTQAGEISRVIDEKYSDELAARLDVEMPFRMGSKIDGYLKFGGKVRDMNRGYENYTKSGSFISIEANQMDKVAMERLPDFDWVLLPNQYVAHGTFALDEFAQDFSIMGTKTYLFPEFDRVETVMDAVYDILYRSKYDEKDNYTNSERYYAGYIMTGIHIGELITFTPGVRYERLDYTTTAKYLELTGDSGGPYDLQGYLQDTTAGHFNEQFFPMFHLKIKPLKWFDIRLAATKTVTRPEYRQMSPRYYRSQQLDVDQGNHYLKPQTNSNYDIYFSFYTGKTGLFTVGAFYKKLTDQVLAYSVKIIEPEEWDLPESFKGKNYTIPKNNEWPGYVQGLELDWQTHFSYLPKPFNGILLNMNLTYMQSETRYPFYHFKTVYLDEYPYIFSVGKDSSRINKVIGMPGMIANVALGYELGGFAGRISAYYQGSTITEAQASNHSLDEDKAALLRLDMQLSQRFKKVPGLILYLNVNNMTNNPDRLVLTHYTDNIVREEKYGVSGDVGVRYKF
ncbi:MAG: carboxypeptidase-like regulatory domain-containing protein [Bacteroidota bacterium]